MRVLSCAPIHTATCNCNAPSQHPRPAEYIRRDHQRLAAPDGGEIGRAHGRAADPAQGRRSRPPRRRAGARRRTCERARSACGPRGARAFGRRRPHRLVGRRRARFSTARLKRQDADADAGLSAMCASAQTFLKKPLSWPCCVESSRRPVGGKTARQFARDVSRRIAAPLLTAGPAISAAPRVLRSSQRTPPRAPPTCRSRHFAQIWRMSCG